MSNNVEKNVVRFTNANLNKLVSELNEAVKTNDVTKIRPATEAVNNELQAVNTEIRHAKYNFVLDNEKEPLKALIIAGIIQQNKLKDVSEKDATVPVYEVATVNTHVDVMEFITYASDTREVSVTVSDAWKHKVEKFALYFNAAVVDKVDAGNKHELLEKGNKVIVPDGLKKTDLGDKVGISNKALTAMLEKVCESFVDLEGKKVVSADINFLKLVLCKASTSEQKTIATPKLRSFVKGITTVMHKILTDAKYEVDIKKL